VLTALDGRVARLVAVELRVVEVDLDLAARESTAAGLAVQVRGACLHPVDRALEQARRERVVDVGDDRDVDLGSRDADLRGFRFLVARLRRGRSDGDDRQTDEQRADQNRVTSLEHRFPPLVDVARNSYTTRSARARGR